VVRSFGLLYTQNEQVRQKLGTPTDIERKFPATMQFFQNGIMYLRPGIKRIYVFYYNGKAEAPRDTWKEGDPIATGQRPPSGNLYEPQRNFGKLWREQPGLQAQLGWAREPEHNFDGVLQVFEHGVMLWCHQRIIYIYYENGTWERALDSYTGE
jgi:hypothetical protein